jgi:hypothetical protein
MVWPPVDDGYRRRIRIDLLELDLLFPHVTQTLNTQLNVGGLYTTTAALPSAGLGFATPFVAHVQFELPRYGEIDVGYKLLAAEGSAVILANFDPFGPAALRSRLDMSVIDINYTNSGYWPGLNLLWFIDDPDRRPPLALRWDLGVRLASVYFDSHAVGPTLERKVSNYFFGGGPRVGLTLTRSLADSGFFVFGRVDGGILMGGARQQFSELAVDLAGNPLGFGYAHRATVQTVPMLTATAGIGGSLPLARRSRWEAGYQFEQWWGLGNFPGTIADLYTHGLVLKWWYNY